MQLLGRVLLISMNMCAFLTVVRLSKRTRGSRLCYSWAPGVHMYVCGGSGVPEMVFMIGIPLL